MAFSLHLEFRSKRDYNRFMRNLKNGKGTVVKPEMLHLGSGIFNKLKRGLKAVASNPIAKAVIGQVKDVALDKVKDGFGQLGQMIDQRTGNNFGSTVTGALGNLATKEASKQIDGYTQGQGLRRKSAQSIYGMGTMQQRMAYVRSKRKGSSILPP